MTVLNLSYRLAKIQARRQKRLGSCIRSLVMALVGYGLALGQDISFYKTEYKIQDVFVASPVSSLTYMTGLALSQILFGLPAKFSSAFQLSWY